MPNTSKTNYPKTIGVIMDGNRRWAKAQGLPTLKGHETGYKKIKDVMHWAKELGVNTVYLYAFSTENWNRQPEEVNYLMELFKRAFGQDAKDLIKEKIRVKFAGQIERFSSILRNSIKLLEGTTKNFTGPTLVICLSYGGRAELLEAVKKIARDKTPAQIAKFTEEDISRYLWTAGLPDPQLVIRTSGEIRTSNFLPWQTAYSEWYFTKTYWPAFTKKEFEKALKNFSEREVRRGR